MSYKSSFETQIRMVKRAEKHRPHRLDSFQDFKIISQISERGQNTAVLSFLLFFPLPSCLCSIKTSLQRYSSQVWTVC